MAPIAENPELGLLSNADRITCGEPANRPERKVDAPTEE
jgi:hypothetical protein